MTKTKNGLFVVATPIGNLGDMSVRAQEILTTVDKIACEDTRVTGKLLSRFSINTPMVVYHDHNADKVRPGLLADLKQGAAIALVSDAGMPAISDPGYKLIRACIEEDIQLTVLPGANALSLSNRGCLQTGSCSRDTRRSPGARSALSNFLHTGHATYETGKRLAKSLVDMVSVWAIVPLVARS